ncbi:GDP-L-fucose synthase [bacterium]|nr:GDP-L-fucose synthase [bacterium]MBT5015695.1 GDP-L-fucose synthase [bacterium]
MDKNARIFVAGHRGLVGSALVRILDDLGYHNLILRSHDELDLTDKLAVEEFFAQEEPDYVFLAAAKVGGIVGNSRYPADFIYENLQIETNVIHSSYRFGVKKLLFLGSSCIYPRMCPQPIKEEYLLSDYLEPTNDAYAIAKIAGIKMCQSYNKQYGTNFIACMPTNLYGLNDNFDLEMSHVLPALIAKVQKAKANGDKNFVVWGTGQVKREFLYVDDLAEACVFLMNNYDDSDIINIGTGEDVTIAQLVEAVKRAIGYDGEIIYDTTKPDGTPRKLLDVSKINNLGWKAKHSLADGLELTTKWYKRTIIG